MDPTSIIRLLGSLVLDATASWIRMFIALGLSVLISLFVGIYVATSKTAEKLIIPVVDILQTLPILAFFPFVLFVFVKLIPGFVGVNIAVIFLIITSMVWNIIFGVYESIKLLPKEYMELGALYKLSISERLRKIFIPAAMPRVVEQSILSWSIGLFYLVTSEIFSYSVTAYHVNYGIGYALANSTSALEYVLGIGVFIAFVIATRLLFFKPWEERVTRYNKYKTDILETKAGTTQAPYTRGLAIGARVMRQLGTDRIIRFGSDIAKRTRIAGKKISRGGIPQIVERNGRAIGYLILALLVLSAAFVLATNAVIRGYESDVISSLAFSFARVWLAFAVILAIGIPVSIYLIFISRHSSKYILLFQILASIPATILLPAIASYLKNYPHSGELMAFIVFGLSGLWYVIFSVMNNTKTLPSNISEVKKVFQVKGWAAWKNIYLKAIIPGLITGGITAIAAEWNASIVAEYFQFSTHAPTVLWILRERVLTHTVEVGTGIGKLLNISLGQGNLALMLVAIINLTAMILIINTFVWKRLYRSVGAVYR